MAGNSLKWPCQSEWNAFTKLKKEQTEINEILEACLCHMVIYDSGTFILVSESYQVFWLHEVQFSLHDYIY